MPRLSSFQILSLTVLLIPLWWLLGVKFVIFHLAAVAAFFVYLKESDREKSGPAAFCKTSPELVLLLGFILLYAVSIAIHFGDIPFPRKIASLNNWSFWVIGFFVVFVVSKGLKRKDLSAFLHCFPVFGALSGLFVLLAFLFGLITGRTLQLPSLLMTVLPQGWLDVISRKALLLQSSLLLNIVGHDKIFQRQIPRSPGFNIYTTALGLTMIVVLLLSILYFRLKGSKKGMFSVLFLEGAALILSFSRTALLAFGAASAFVLFVAFVPRSLQWKIVAAGLLAVLVFFIVVPPASVWNTVSEFRRGSTVWRGRLYRATLEESLKQPLLGHGFKPRTDEFPIPVASHS
ncbi:MAG: O-antigen ligase family protein, partial [Candidatus Aminicenantes bacterium]|nr:O-antigen ligase family protein [Candidatus Aminicenantes bacterium]